MLDKTFDPKSVEPRLYARWEASGAFAPTDDPAAEPFCIVIPPPNVTGSLHVGHALNNTLQDVLTRFERMRGKAALWLPGTDHAGIATQMVVERQLAAAGNIGRRDMGREAFVQKVWEWKAESGGTIINQLKRLGASCDWSRERFTLDEGLSAAVRKVFVTLHREGLIYRDKRLVNWHPELQTAISDLEVENVEVNGHMWRFRYPLADGVTYRHPIAFGEDGAPTEWETRDYIVVATTRPETMLGDIAVAVNPEDERYKVLIGKQVMLPLADRLIPIICDEHADPEKGTGAVKITPAHDFNDFQVGKRHGLPMINIFTPDARLKSSSLDDFSFGHRASGPGGATLADEESDTEPVYLRIPKHLRGLDRFEARKQVVADLEAIGLLDGIENHKLMLPYDEKSKAVVIEPYLTDQWYVDAKTLAGPAIAAVEDGRTTLQPKNWEKTYFEWMRNIEPWCISRQLWWGHRIPVWYGPDGHVFVKETEDEARAAALAHYGHEEPLSQDEDVLDTWFSSALWAFSTLGWPDRMGDVNRFYPTSILITAGDIIFFWVARMMMMGLHFMKDVPFREVFLNALVLDEKGQKMSKVKGNVIDPLELIDAYGADALRFTMTAITGQTRHIRLSKQRVEGYRNFGTKLWNAARFCQMNDCRRDAAFDPASARLPVNRWIRGQTVRAAAEMTAALEARAFDEAAGVVYRFVWNVVCDWYVELAKPVLNGPDGEAKTETRAMAAWVLDQAMKLLHPIMPFITEELWDKLGGEGMLMTASWPRLPDAWIDAEADAEIELVTGAVGEGRSVRSELNVPPSARPPLIVVEASEAQRRAFEANAAVIAQTLRVEGVRFDAVAPAGSVPFVVAGATLALPVAEFIDLAAESARLSKEIAALTADIDRTAKKLANPDFVSRAPEEVVEENRERQAEAEAARAKLDAALKRLEAVG